MLSKKQKPYVPGNPAANQALAEKCPRRLAEDGCNKCPDRSFDTTLGTDQCQAYGVDAWINWSLF